MNTHILIGKLTLALTCSLALIGCQSNGQMNTGQLSFQFQVPTAAPVQFQLQAIPAATERFEIEVSGKGLTKTRKVRIDINGSEGTQSHTMAELPTGNKTVIVKAFQANNLLAEASSDVKIIADKTARAVLELQPVAQESETGVGEGDAVLLLNPALPLAVEVQIQVSGEGLEDTVRKTIRLRANQDKASLGVLPAGSKQARVVFSTEAAGQSIASEPETVDFDVPTDGQATLELSAAELLKSYEQQLDKLLDGLTPLQLVALLGQVSPEKLTELFEGLPADVQDRLRNNPTLSQFINFAEPTPAPTTAPSTEPMPEPTPEATAAPTEDGLLMDVRFAMVSQERPNLVLARPAQTELGNIKLLTSGDSNTLFRSSAWGLFIRTHYTGPQQVNCVVKFTRDSDGQEVYLKEFQMGTKFTVNEKGFTGAVALFNEGQPVTLEPGAYTLQVQVTDPDTNELERGVYPLNFVAPLGS